MRGGDVAVDGELHREDGAEGIAAEDHENHDDLVFHRDERTVPRDNLPGHHPGKLHEADCQHRIHYRHERRVPRLA